MGMNWLRSHPYLDSLVGALALLIVGALVVRTQLSAPVQQSNPKTWETVGGIEVNTVSHGYTRLPDSREDVGPKAISVGYIPLQTQNEIGTGPEDTSDYDLSALLSLLSHSESPQISSETAPQNDAYAFIPRGLIATSSLQVPTRTALQNDLYNYGNEVGDAIIAFENQHPNQVQILTDQFEQPQNPNANAALKKLGNDFSALGSALSSMELIPLQAKTSHDKLAAAYIDIGSKLAAIPDAKSDDARYDAIQTYDRAAESFVKQFVALALLFESYGVTFSPGDGGSVFVFNNTNL